MKRKKTEQHFGVPPKELDGVYQFESIKPEHHSFIVHKSAKKGQNSFRITKSLLESLIKTSIQIQKNPILVISIVDGSSDYTITCSITKK